MRLSMYLAVENTWEKSRNPGSASEAYRARLLTIDHALFRSGTGRVGISGSNIGDEFLDFLPKTRNLLNGIGRTLGHYDRYG
jgi:hypothetical protein